MAQRMPFLCIYLRLDSSRIVKTEQINPTIKEYLVKNHLLTNLITK